MNDKVYWQDVVLLLAGAVTGVGMVRMFAYWRIQDILLALAGISVAYVTYYYTSAPDITILSFLQGKLVGMAGIAIGLILKRRKLQREQPSGVMQPE